VKSTALAAALEAVDGKDVLVSYSGGKDSMICLDLAKRCGARVEAFFLELVPGLQVVEERIAWAEARFGLTIRRYPHWLRAVFARDGVYRFHATDAVQLDIGDLYTVARADTGISLIVTGAKKGDSLWRRRTGATKFAGDDLKAPLWDWSSRDVAGYLRSRNLPLPPSDGRQASGIDLTEECVTWLHDEHRQDYETLVAAYPFAGALVARREFYGDRDARWKAARAEKEERPEGEG
jgi:phosphoadenosine phosphosulfate reductase